MGFVVIYNISVRASPHATVLACCELNTVNDVAVEYTLSHFKIARLQ